MKYKALMLDIDGTIIPYDYDALPSKKVAEAIQKAQEKVTVCFVTGRAYDAVLRILKKLNISSGYVVVNNGANVLDIKTHEVLYDKAISFERTQEIAEILYEEDIEFYVKEDLFTSHKQRSIAKPGDRFEKSYMFYAFEQYPSDKMERIFDKLSKMHDIFYYKTHHGEDGRFGINITHIEATKLHGIEVVIKRLGVEKSEIVGVGDSYNDFPLLMASGLKVAMGNAISELKEIADFVAPKVTEDGVAHVIDKFILSESSE